MRNLNGRQQKRDVVRIKGLPDTVQEIVATFDHERETHQSSRFRNPTFGQLCGYEGIKVLQ